MATGRVRPAGSCPGPTGTVPGLGPSFFSASARVTAIGTECPSPSSSASPVPLPVTVSGTEPEVQPGPARVPGPPSAAAAGCHDLEPEDVTVPAVSVTHHSKKGPRIPWRHWGRSSYAALITLLVNASTQKVRTTVKCRKISK